MNARDSIILPRSGGRAAKSRPCFSADWTMLLLTMMDLAERAAARNERFVSQQSPLEELHEKKRSLYSLYTVSR